jgi:hypothetical protein
MLSDGALRQDQPKGKPSDLFRNRVLNFVLLLIYCSLVWTVVLVVAHEFLLPATHVAASSARPD